ncbi:hypothetical protein CROQUDRAFT_713498 [Cronartium quercuum f. sp. fusiforme G11]|uniref:Uncharacterized protein n=1 Tax=Cronartium quercuum f. sp. fusiforme G11 TaxID=708437 RepID=A0A9P6NTP2_9BASI|nr:hypothetical protein CROQUDRAFT_713498 [Cronartium quercuum f. sp. fusiforme G11]
MRFTLTLSGFRLVTITWLVQVSLGDSSFSFTSPNLARTQWPYNHDSHDLTPLGEIWKRQQVNQLPITTAKQPQIALNWPRISTWSSLSLPIQLIANSPLTSTGLIAISIATILAFNDQLNFFTVFILLSAFLSFVGGILELLNLINTETSLAGKTPSISFATAIFLGGGILFKYLFLFFRFERPMSSRASIKSLRDIIPPNSTSIWKTPNWDQVGPYGKLVKIFVLILTISIAVLETAWNIGILSSINRFQLVSRASAVLQMLLLILLSVKTVYFSLKSKSVSHEAFSTIKRIGPVLVGNSIGLATQILALEITALVETPLGRFLNLIQVYFYIIDAAIHCCRSEPIRQSVNQVMRSLDPEKGLGFSQSAFPPAFKSLSDEPVLSELSTLGYSRRTIISPESSEHAKEWSHAHPNQRAAEPNLNYDDAHDHHIVQRATNPISLTPPVPNSIHPTLRRLNSLEPESALDSAETAKSASEDYLQPSAINLTQPNEGSMSPILVNHPATSRRAKRRSNGVSELGPTISLQPSTLYSQYYTGAYDSNIPPPPPAPHNLLKSQADQAVERTPSAPIIAEPIGLFGPPPQISLPPTPLKAQSVSGISANDDRDVEFYDNTSSILSSSFSLSRIVLMEEIGSSTSVVNPYPISDNFTVNPYLPDQEEHPLASSKSLEDLNLITPQHQSLSSQEYSSHALSDDLGHLILEADAALHAISDQTLLRSSATDFELIPPQNPSVLQRDRVDSRVRPDTQSSRHFLGSNIDVTSFIGGLTFLPISEEDQSGSAEANLDNLRLDEPEASHMGEGSSSATEDLIGIPTITFELGKIYQFENEDQEGYVASSSTVFTSSPTASLQIIDSHGLPIIRDYAEDRSSNLRILSSEEHLR